MRPRRCCWRLAVASSVTVALVLLLRSALRRIFGAQVAWVAEVPERAG
jgi:hypothetical protein